MTDNPMFNKLAHHLGHDIEIAEYKNRSTGRVENLAVECVTCNEVLYDEDNGLEPED